MQLDQAQRSLAEQGRPARGYFSLSIRRLLRKKLGMICLVIITVMYTAGILAPFVTPYGYNEQDLSNAKQGSSIEHPFGTDRLGRDILTRVIWSLRTTVILTITVTVSGSLILGLTAGLAAGYFGKLIDTAIMRIGEVSSAFPEIFLILIIVATVKPPLTGWIIDNWGGFGASLVREGIPDYLILAMALSIFSWFGMARLVRGQVLQVRENQYVEAARSIGASTPRILFRHVFPNIMGPVIVVLSAGMAAIAGSEVLLSWLGIGIQPPRPSLGLMLFANGSISTLRSNPHLLLFPVGTLSLLLFTFNLLGDAVNDAFNPKAR